MSFPTGMQGNLMQGLMRSSTAQHVGLLAAGGVKYAGGGVSASTTERGAGILLPGQQPLKNLACFIDVALGAGSVVIDVLINGVATGLTCTIDVGAALTVVKDIAHIYQPSQFDRMTFRATPTGVIVASTVSCYVEGG